MLFHLSNFLRLIKGSAHIQKYQCNGSSNSKRLICSSTQSQKFLNFFTRKFWELRSAMFASLVFLNVLLLIGSHAVHYHWWWLVGEDGWVDNRQPKVKSNLCQSCQMELLKLGSLKISRSSVAFCHARICWWNFGCLFSSLKFIYLQN